MNSCAGAAAELFAVEDSVSVSNVNTSTLTLMFCVDDDWPSREAILSQSMGIPPENRTFFDFLVDVSFVYFKRSSTRGSLRHIK
jgi:hypothetical protein